MVKLGPQCTLQSTSMSRLDGAGVVGKRRRGTSRTGSKRVSGSGSEVGPKAGLPQPTDAGVQQHEQSLLLKGCTGRSRQDPRRWTWTGTGTLRLLYRRMETRRRRRCWRCGRRSVVDSARSRSTKIHQLTNHHVLCVCVCVCTLSSPTTFRRPRAPTQAPPESSAVGPLVILDCWFCWVGQRPSFLSGPGRSHPKMGDGDDDDDNGGKGGVGSGNVTSEAGLFDNR
jgi:hypothetical protein